MWNTIPSFADVREAYLRRARVQGGIRVLELRIQILEAGITLRKPRNTAIRILGDEETVDEMRELRQELTALRVELDEAEAEIKLLEFHKDIYKSLAYSQKL